MKERMKRGRKSRAVERKGKKNTKKKEGKAI